MSAAAVPKEDLGGGIVRQMLGHGPDLMLLRVWFAKGAVGAIHSHPHCQSSYVESGLFEVNIDGRQQVLGPGDSFYVAPHLDHGVVCVKAGVLLDAFTPAREDFLPGGERR